MNIHDNLNIKLSIVSNHTFTLEDRMKALSFVLDYVCSMVAPDQYCVSIINHILIELESHNPNECRIELLASELGTRLSLKKEDGILTVVISEKNKIYEVLREKCTNIMFVSLENFSLQFVENYDYFVQTGEACFPNSLLSRVSVEKTINLYGICEKEFLGVPLRWHILQNYKKNVANADTLVTGMSYSRNALIPEYLHGRVCNISNSSQDLYYDYRNFCDAYERNQGLKRLIIGLAPYSLRYDLSLTRNPNEIIRLYYYYSLFHDCHNNQQMKNELTKYDVWLQKCNELFGNHFLETIYEAVKSEEVLEGEFKGYSTFDEKQITAAEREQMHAKYNKPYEKTVVENKKILRDYIADALGKEMKVCMFIPPYSMWYKNNWKEEYLSELRLYLNELKTDYEFEIIDLADMDLPDDCFGDYAHVNRIGAIMISNRVNEFLM